MSKQWLNYVSIGFITAAIIIMLFLIARGSKKTHLSPEEKVLFRDKSYSEKVLLPQKIDEKLFTQ